jgi:hypothetical protein
MFSALPDDSILNAGSPYTFTYRSDSKLELRTVGTVQDAVQKVLGKYGSIKVDSKLGSSNFIVTIIPNKDTKIALWRNGIEAAFANIGLQSFIFVESEGGLVSSKPGGIVAATTEILHDTTSAASSILWNTIKPLLPWVLLAGGAYIGFQIYLAKQMGGVKSNPRRKQKRKR